MPPDPALAEVGKRPLLASYDTYLDAQKAVDTLSDKGFPVRNVAIVGVDVRIVESVIGRMSWGRAAASGMASGAWFGVLIMLLIGLFAAGQNSTWNLIGLGIVYGGAFGIVFGLISYAFTGGRRDFVSRSQLVAARYDVVCEASVIADARAHLGLGGVWPPAVPGAATETDSDSRGTSTGSP